MYDMSVETIIQQTEMLHENIMNNIFFLNIYIINNKSGYITENKVHFI